MLVHITSVIRTRQHEATTPEDGSVSLKIMEKELPQNSNLKHAAYRAEAESLRQLSRAGPNLLKFMQGQRRLSPDKQGYSCVHNMCRKRMIKSKRINWINIVSV